MNYDHFLWGQILATSLSTQDPCKVAQKHLDTYCEFFLEQEELEVTKEERDEILERWIEEIKQVQTSFDCFTVHQFQS